MRILEYKQELFGHGYTVVSGDKHYESIPHQECSKWLPISMTYLPALGEFYIPSPEEAVEILTTFVEIDWDKKDETFFRVHYADIMRGKCPGWQLITFRVMVGCVSLGFYDCKNGGYDYLLLKDDVGCGLNIRFEVPRPDGGPEMRYMVSMDSGQVGCRQTKVVEYATHARREIEFFFKDPNKTDPFVDDQYIEITEYADL